VSAGVCRTVPSKRLILNSAQKTKMMTVSGEIETVEAIVAPRMIETMRIAITTDTVVGPETETTIATDGADTMMKKATMKILTARKGGINPRC
jgi:hypothetical protein